MKHAFIVALTTAAIAGCATTPSPTTPAPAQGTRAIGESKLAPKAAAQCIAGKWAQGAGQPVMMQYVLANDTAFDVYVPGQQPPAGAAAVVRPAATGTGSQIGFRGADSGAASGLGECQ